MIDITQKVKKLIDTYSDDLETSMVGECTYLKVLVEQEVQKTMLIEYVWSQ